MSIEQAVSRFGGTAKAKLANPAAAGEPEDQLRAPFEQLVRDVAQILGLPAGAVVTVGETALAAHRSRPDYSVTLRHALTGFVELKAPGKGADPRRFKGHDKLQWQRLQSLPNLMYSDGNEFSLWRDGELAMPIVRLTGDIESSGTALGADHRLTDLFDAFFRVEPDCADHRSRTGDPQRAAVSPAARRRDRSAGTTKQRTEHARQRLA